MNKIKKRGLIALLCATAAGAVLVACGGDDVTNKFVTYDGQSITKSGKDGAAIEFPEVKRDGYAFDGWYVSADFSGEPVKEATYKKGVTYYAKWSPVYEVKFDLDGGSFTTSTAATLPLELRAGELVYNHVADYVPTKGDLQFGSWFIGDDELSQTYAMTQYGVTLTAKYKAAYTVNVYLQNSDLNGYTLQSTPITGYEYVDEEFNVPAIEGFELADSDADKLPLEIGEDSTKNVFTLHYDRLAYNVIYNANYPDGSENSIIEEHYYGVAFDLPTDLFSYDGYRIAGWSESVDAEVSDIIDGKDYSVKRGTVLYAVWNRGYTDMFGGSDYIFVSPLGDGKATLNRGGIDIEGTYDERHKVYTFTGTDGFNLRAKVVESSGRFVYYSDIQGSVYYLYANGAVDQNFTLSLEQPNTIKYYGTAAGNRFNKEGTYSINDMGIYVAEFNDGSSFEFLLGTTSDGSNRSIFRIRGEEYEYGAMGMLGAYYPVIVLDGFGNVMYISSSTAREAYYTYNITKTEDKEIITIASPASSMTVRVFDYDGTYGYELYNAALDREFTDGTRTLTLDGCSNATYNDGNTTVTGGKYSVEQSVFGGYIVTMTRLSRTYVFRVYSEGEGSNASAKVEVLANNYTEYRYLTPTGSLGNEPYLVVNGTDTAALYEQHDGTLQMVSSGSFKKQGDSYLYTAVGDIAEWAKNKYTALVVNLDTQSSSYKVYYRLSATDESGETDNSYTTVYTNADPKDKTTLTLASSFAFYNNGASTVSGAYTDRTTYIMLQSGTAYYYFSLDKENHTFERLSRAPVVLTYMSSSNVSSTGTTLTVTGRKLDDNSYEAIHAVTSGANTVITRGRYTAVEVAGPGLSASVCTFVSDDETLTFKFLMAVINNNNYFIYYEADQTVDLVTYTEANENGNTVNDSTVVLTDKSIDGVNVVEYRNGDTVVEGTCSEAALTVFGKYKFTIYTFTSTDGKTVFDFTLVNSYFRRCSTVETFTAADGSKLTIDGRVHVARYVDSSNAEFDAGYVVLTNVLDENDRAVMMNIEDAAVYFDIDTAAKTFTRRGAEAASYMVFDNTFSTGKAITLDGHGNATLTANSVQTKGTYTQKDGLFTVVFGNEKYIGRLDTITINNTAYNAFVLSMDGIAGSYINKADLSVLVLDDVGNIVKYSSRGIADNGTYVRIDDKTFYYVNGDDSDAAMYTITASGEVVGANYTATYYADDFSSIVFYTSGALVINNNDVKYFTYDKATKKIYTYEPSNSDKANKYGFLREEFVISSDDTITDNGVVYSKYDGKYVVLVDKDGNKIEFMPTGAAEFTVEATYTKAGETKGDNSYWLSVYYDDKGDVFVSLDNVERMAIAGSYDKYSMVAGANLDVSFINKTFGFTDADMEYAIVAYDYQYMVVIGTYDMNTAIGQLYASWYFGQINIDGKRNAAGNIDYTLSGQINAIAPSGRRSVSFENGKLSVAGYRNSNYGNMFTAEFVGDDDNTYHMNFFLIPSGIEGMCVYLVYSCTRVDKQNVIELADGSVVYAEEFVYTSGFEIPKGDGTNFKVGDKYFPTLKYKGEIICAVDYEVIDANTWRFMAPVYVDTVKDANGKAVDRYVYYYYYYMFNINSDESITPVSVVRRVGYSIYAGDDTVRVITSSTTDVNGIYDIMYIVYNGEMLTFTSCVNGGDGTFTATTADGDSYTIAFTETEDGATTKIVATITPIEE